MDLLCSKPLLVWGSEDPSSMPDDIQLLLWANDFRLVALEQSTVEFVAHRRHSLSDARLSRPNSHYGDLALLYHQTVAVLS